MGAKEERRRSSDCSIQKSEEGGNFLEVKKPPYLTKILSDIKEESTDRLHTFDVESRPPSAYRAV